MIDEHIFVGRDSMWNSMETSEKATSFCSSAIYVRICSPA